MIIEEMDSIFEKEAEYKALIQQASTAYLNNQFNASLSKYNDALVLSTELKATKMTKTIFKYMICLCLMESNKYEDLREVVMMLQTLDKSMKDRFPDIYCLLAKAHCKLYRFDQAIDAINEGIAAFKTNRLLETFYIPGTHIVINERDQDIWLKIKEECLTWHKPDAICNLADCCNITAPYVTANKNIFLKDPAFTGMVVVHCNNKKRPCSLTFHQCCWKFKKDQMYPFEKISDKDILGNHCFTPNCVNDNNPCIVSAIEVVGANGEVKAHVKESLSLPWPGHKNASKGAIKKTKPNTPRKMENPAETVRYPVTVKQEFIEDKQISRNSFEDDQILAVNDEFTDMDFSNESPDLAGEKNFLFSFFHHYIQNNLVRVSDAYKKFTEINEDLMYLKKIDIMEFLLSTNKIEVLGKKPERDSLPSRNQENVQIPIKTEKIDKVNLNKTIEIEDMYNELMSDDYDYFEMTNNCPAGNQPSSNKSQCHGPTEEGDLHEKYKLSLNGSNTNFGYEHAAGDTSRVANNYTTYNFPNEHHFNEPEKKPSENRKLKEYIEKLESDMKEIMDKMDGLKKELKNKDEQIITLTKEQEEYTKEVDKVCENMKSFQIRHDEIKEENLRIKTEMISVLRDRKALEEKLLEIDNRDSKKQELLKMFQEEYKILEEHINEDWKEKTDKLEKALEDQNKMKKSLLNKCINYQYSANRNVIKGHLDQCSTALDVICKINHWMESTLGIKIFLDNTEWLTRLKYLNNILTNYQSDYSQILDKLVSDEIDDEDINISLLLIPKPPSVTLSELVQNALNTFYKGQCHVMQSAMKLQQQSMAYQMPAMQVNNVPYSQFSQQYPYSSVYPPPRPPIIANSLMAPPSLMNFSMPRMNMPLPPLIPQNYVQPVHHLPKVKDLISNSNDEKLVDSTSANFEPDSSNSDVVESKMENVTISNEEIQEEDEQEKKEEEEEEVQEKQENFIEKEEEIKQSIDQISIRNEKMVKMKQACKAIALQIQQKTTLDSYDNERFDLASNKQLSIYSKVEEENSSIDNNENVKTNSLALACIDSVSNSTVNSSEENTVKQRKKIGIDGLIKMMKQKYPESLEVEIIEAISDIRKRHDNSLSRMPVNQILQESDEFMKQKHNLHTLRYNKNEGNKSSHNETSEQHKETMRPTGLKTNGKKIEISSVSSNTSLSKLEDTSTQKKKTWNKITQSDVQWTSSGETECSICMTVVTNKANCYTLSCRHSFHRQCVKSWLKSDRSCPNCRIAVTEDDEFPPLPA